MARSTIRSHFDFFGEGQLALDSYGNAVPSLAELWKRRSQAEIRPLNMSHTIIFIFKNIRIKNIPNHYEMRHLVPSLGQDDVPFSHLAITITCIRYYHIFNFGHTKLS